MSSFNQAVPGVPTLINSSSVLVTGNAASANALTVRQFGGGNVFSAQTTTGSTALFVGANGNVGVGTTSPQTALDVNGTVTAGASGTTGRTQVASDAIEIGSGRTVDGTSLIDFHSADATYGDFAFRILRNGGANGTVDLVHRGTGGFGYYTQEAAAHVWYTSNTEKMRLTAAGNVGIGTASPGYQLTVTSNIYNESSGGGFYGMNCGNLNGLIQGVYNGGSANPDGLANSDMFIGVNYNQQTGQRLAGTNHGVAQIQLVGANPGAGNIKFRCAAGGTGALASVPVIATITTTGVGIGTASPVAGLHCFSTTNASLTTNGSPGSGVVIGSDLDYGRNPGEYSPVLHFRQSYFTAGSGSISTGGIAGYKTVANGSFGGGLAFLYCADGATSLAQGMTLTATGRIGIGTTSPGNLLTVNNGTTDGTVLRLVGGNGASSLAGPSLDFSISNLPTYSGASIKSLNTYTDGGGQAAHLAFSTSNWNGSTGSNTERMRITNAGNVGIGTTNPSSYTLQVSGTIGATGDITAYFSDERLKTKTGLIESALEKVLSLEAFTYVPNDLAKSFGFEDSKQRVGLSAQSVQRVLPEAVCPAPFDADNASGQGYLTVQYDKLVPLLVEAIKELAGRGL